MANQKEGAKAARGMAAFVQSTLDMVSINVADDETGEKTYSMVIGGEREPCLCLSSKPPNNLLIIVLRINMIEQPTYSYAAGQVRVAICVFRFFRAFPKFKNIQN